MWTYNHSDELCHYGVMGMKWGIRRARRKEAKSNYKKAEAKAFSKYEKSINSIEKKYKRGQNLSKKDQTRELKAESDYKSAVNKAKTNYKTAKKSKSNDLNIANRLYSKHTNALNKKIVNMDMGKAAVETFFMSSYGALKYNDARVNKGNGTVKSIVKSQLKFMGNTALGHIPGAVGYTKNRIARRKA
jgi:hypothetical protein